MQLNYFHTMGIEDQLKKSKILGRLPLHCLPFDFL